MTGGTLNNNFLDNQPGQPIDDFIPGYDELAPEVKGEKLIEFLVDELKLRKINPDRIFAMADARRANKVKLRACLQALKKVIPDLSTEFLNELPPVLEKSIDDIITKAQFD